MLLASKSLWLNTKPFFYKGYTVFYKNAIYYYVVHFLSYSKFLSS